MGFMMKTTVSFSLAILTTYLLFSAAPSASTAVNTFCDAADDKVLCMQMVKNAKTWAEAMINVLQAAQEKAKTGKKVADDVGSQLPCNLAPQTKESISNTCHEAYNTVIHNINSCIGFVKNDPTSALNSYLSATSFSDCTDALNEFGVSVSEATDYGNEILKMSGILLAVAQKKPGE